MNKKNWACCFNPPERNGQSARADWFFSLLTVLTWPTQIHPYFVLNPNRTSAETDPDFNFFLPFFSLSLSLSLPIFTIHLLLQVSFPLSHLPFHLLTIWTSDLESPRREALGRTLRFKLLQRWILGLLQNQTSNQAPSYLYVRGRNPLTFVMFLEFNSSIPSYFIWFLELNCILLMLGKNYEFNICCLCMFIVYDYELKFHFWNILFLM